MPILCTLAQWGQITLKEYFAKEPVSYSAFCNNSSQVLLGATWATTPWTKLKNQKKLLHLWLYNIISIFETVLTFLDKQLIPLRRED